MRPGNGVGHRCDVCTRAARPRERAGVGARRFSRQRAPVDSWNNGTGSIIVGGYSDYHGDVAAIKLVPAQTATVYVHNGAPPRTATAAARR